MGLDIYLRWEGMTKEERKAQITGYSIVAGKVGYLRGAYNGHIGLDALNILFKDINFDGYDWIVNIKFLEKQLEELEKGLFITRKKDFYDGKEGSEIQSYRDFVALARKLYDEDKEPRIHGSG
jgi:hypothetical protein